MVLYNSPAGRGSGGRAPSIVVNSRAEVLLTTGGPEGPQTPIIGPKAQYYFILGVSPPDPFLGPEGPNILGALPPDPLLVTAGN